MSFADERAAIESRFDAQWKAGPYGLWPVGYENTPFERPSPPSGHALLFIRDGNANQISLGSTPTVRHAIVIIAQVFTLPDSGTNLARQVADFIATIWDNQQFSSGASGTITCRRSSITTLPDVDGGYLHTDVSTPCQRDAVG